MVRGNLKYFLSGLKVLKTLIFSGRGRNQNGMKTVFSISEGVEELFLEDNGQIPIEPVFSEGSIPTTCYNVVKDEEYCGEIRVGLTFTPENILRGSTKKKVLVDGKESSH
ncbi:hypothetical protein HAX54_041337 [Datura stramonium]|uniref:Uncharacterized protein n=1 Tax=Datura stramonium TaxID=4076 RepID=A0ABS8SKV2_DATST|nr:hypothetical protein [Datura stramonium]